MAVRRTYCAVQIDSKPVNILSVEVSEGHKQVTARVSIETNDISTIGLNKVIEVDMGYVDDHAVLFRGYVDEIIETRMPATYRIEGRDLLKKAIEHFIVTTDIENPWSRTNIDAEDLVGDLLSEARIDVAHYHGDESLFTFGVDGPAEFNLMTSWDAIGQICNILAYNCYAESGEVYFKRVFPVPGPTSTHSFNVGDSGDIVIVDYSYNTDNLRNKVVVFGKEGIHAEASAESPYLPPSFYKTAIVSSELIESKGMAEKSADYNLDLYNKLTENLRIDALGNSHVRCRDTVDVTEPFTDMSATKWFVYAVSHRVDDSGYKMSLNLTR